VVLEALRELRRDRETPPSDEVIEVGLELMKSRDAEVRHDAISALSLHWGHLRTLPLLRAMLEGAEKEVEVLLIAARALGSMCKQHGCRLDEETRRVLARVALDERAEAELRGVAYASLRLASGLLSAREEARIEDDIHQMEVDWEWLRAMDGLSPGKVSKDSRTS
jgi:HEAT repeat protein